MLAHVFSFLLHQRPTYSVRSPQSWRKSLANVCESVLVDALAALLQSGVPVLYNTHLFGPKLIRCDYSHGVRRESTLPFVVKVNFTERMTPKPVVTLPERLRHGFVCHSCQADVSTQQIDSWALLSLR